MRALTRVAVGGLVAVLVAIAAAVFYADRLVEEALERGGQHALGVETRVGSVQLGLMRGRVRLGDLELANPPNFDPEPFLAIGSASAEVGLDELRGDTVRVPRILLEGVALRIERRAGKTNYAAILDHAAGLGEAAEPETEAGASKRFVVGELVIRDVTAHLELAPAPGFELNIPEIRLENLGDEGSEGIRGTQIAVLVVRELLAQVARQRELPAELAGHLTDQVKKLPQLAEALEGLAGLLAPKENE